MFVLNSAVEARINKRSSSCLPYLKTWVAEQRKPPSMNIMQSEPQSSIDEIKPSSQKASLLHQLLSY
ncbi:hypothetical protein DPMN_019126 [Dreissena polymorpha]|uniref:Uncharacterized protein n=1 Tax=Dreissena polymorpha TaxID=45954 RepID=A0A9D4NHS5_DREPO|nr:hypothetical protein DPMN_019126 [Dreissena polymorpha]